MKREREILGVKVIGSHHQLKSHFWINVELCLLATAQKCNRACHQCPFPSLLIYNLSPLYYLYKYLMLDPLLQNLSIEGSALPPDLNLIIHPHTAPCPPPPPLAPKPNVHNFTTPNASELKQETNLANCKDQ
jgi:hypothetical protein